MWWTSGNWFPIMHSFISMHEFVGEKLWADSESMWSSGWQKIQMKTLEGREASLKLGWNRVETELKMNLRVNEREWSERIFISFFHCFSLLLFSATELSWTNRRWIHAKTYRDLSVRKAKSTWSSQVEFHKQAHFVNKQIVLSHRTPASGIKWQIDSKCIVITIADNGVDIAQVLKESCEVPMQMQMCKFRESQRKEKVEWRRNNKPRLKKEKISRNREKWLNTQRSSSNNTAKESRKVCSDSYAIS